MSIHGTSRLTFQELWDSISNIFDGAQRPLLAHYTSLDVIEAVAKNNELWLSNPLYMNDLQEMRFGLNEGSNTMFALCSIAPSVEKGQRLTIITEEFRRLLSHFEQNYAMGVYVFCLSERDPSDNDGLLSMWRGYGGYGSGAAIVFRTDFMAPNERSPLLMAKVSYGSTEERKQWLRDVVDTTITAAYRDDATEESLREAARQAFELMLMYSLTTKHSGFSEEREWRLIYLPDRDKDGWFSQYHHYRIGKNGVEPKLRLPMHPLPSEVRDSWTFDSIVDRIILGPSLTSTGSVLPVSQMLKSLGRQGLAEKVVASAIPLRPH